MPIMRELIEAHRAEYQRQLTEAQTLMQQMQVQIARIEGAISALDNYTQAVEQTLNVDEPVMDEVPDFDKT